MERPKSLLERIQEALTLTPGISLTSGTPKTPLPTEFTPPAQETPSLVDRVLPKVYDPLQQQQQDIAKLAISATPLGAADDFNKAVGDSSPLGISLAGLGAIPGGGMLSRARNLPKLWGGYHGTKVKEYYEKFKLPPPEQDIGIHATTHPRVARQYALGMNQGGTLTGHERTIPVVADIRSPVKFPKDPIVWNSQEQFRDFMGLEESNSVLQTLKNAPGYEQLYRDLARLDAKPGGWNANFIPEMQNRGYDAIHYPHMPEYRGAPEPFNSFMVFDPNQIHGKFTPEGQALAAERGVKKPKSILTMQPGELKNWQEQYNMAGIFEKSKEEVYKKLGVDPNTPLGTFFHQFPEYTVSANSQIVKNPKYSPYPSGWGDINQPYHNPYAAYEEATGKMHPAELAENHKFMDEMYSTKGETFAPQKPMTQTDIDRLNAESYPASEGWQKTPSGFHYKTSEYKDPGVQQYSISAKPGPLEQAALNNKAAKGLTMTHSGYFKSPPEEIVKNIFPKASKDKLDELIKALTDWEKRQ